MRALMVKRVFLGAKGLRQCFASLPRARDARAHVRKLCSGRTVRAPAVASRFSVSRPFRLSGARGARRCVAKRLGIAARGVQWERLGAPGVASFEKDAVGRDALR